MKPVVRVKAVSRRVPVVVPFVRPDRPELSSMLRQFDELVGNGELSGLAIAGVRYDGGISTAFVLGNSTWELIGVIKVLEARVEKEYWDRLADGRS